MQAPGSASSATKLPSLPLPAAGPPECSGGPATLCRSAVYVDKILRGTRPADIPVELPMTFDFVVNLKTAAALGITFPNEIMLQVTEVVQ